MNKINNNNFGGLMKENGINKKVKSVIESYSNNGINNTDSHDSYTGKPEDKHDKPEKNAEDF